MSSNGAPFRELGRVVLLVDDQERALAFYRDVLGFETLHDEDASGLRYLHVGLPGQPRVGLWLMPATDEESRLLVGRQAGGRPLLVLYTDDLDAVRRRLAEHDVDVWAERADDTGRSLHFRDVAGSVIVAAELT
jgi:catechol 2,3-dioxygenase-like lactoylglutathione lyase family enzyme